MKRARSTIVSAAAVLVLLTGAGIGYWWLRAEPAPTYRELTVTRENISIAVVATGVVQPSNRLEIKPPIAGRVEEILVREGQYVRRGEIIAWISSSERAALIDAARAKGPEELKRWEELYRPTPVVAPINGTIILRAAEPGQTFQSQDAMLAMSDKLIVRAQVDETDIARVKLKQPATIALDAYPDQPIEGRVDAIAFEAKIVNNVTTYGVDVLPAKVPGFMRSGMTANVRFVLAERNDVLTVPAEAVRTRQGNSRVLLAPVHPRDPPIEREVDLGLTDGRRTEVLAGLADGDRVLVPQISGLSNRSGGSNPLGSPFGRRR